MHKKHESRYQYYMSHDYQNTQVMMHDTHEAEQANRLYRINTQPWGENWMRTHHMNVSRYQGALHALAIYYTKQTNWHDRIFELTAEKDDLRDINKERSSQSIYAYHASAKLQRIANIRVKQAYHAEYDEGGNDMPQTSDALADKGDNLVHGWDGHTYANARIAKQLGYKHMDSVPTDDYGENEGSSSLGHLTYEGNPKTYYAHDAKQMADSINDDFVNHDVANHEGNGHLIMIISGGYDADHNVWGYDPGNRRGGFKYDASAVKYDPYSNQADFVEEYA